VGAFETEDRATAIIMLLFLPNETGELRSEGWTVPAFLATKNGISEQL
jgi:hypothetical protein